MKLFLMLIGLAGAGILGYMKEPSLRFALTGIGPNGAAPSSASVNSAPIIATAPVIDPASLTPEQLPEKVTINSDIKFNDDKSGLTMTVAAGSKVKLVRIQGSDAVVRPGDTPYSIVLPIDKTDLMAQLAANPPSAVKPEPVPTPEPVVEPKPEPKPEPTPVTEPAPTPSGDSQEPAPVPEPAVEPKPEPAPEPAPAPAAAEPAPTPASNDVVQIMQESVRSGQIKEFKFEQVLGWENGGTESLDGESYQSGNVSYKAETIFGVKTIQARALIKDGKVVRWVWPKSGMEIK